MLCAPSPGVTWAHVIELVGRAGAVMLGINCALASALDLAGFGTLPWLLLAYRASIFFSSLYSVFIIYLLYCPYIPILNILSIIFISHLPALNGSLLAPVNLGAKKTSRFGWIQSTVS
jgi:hypothetical protein